jgi:hypothetical protein
MTDGTATIAHVAPRLTPNDLQRNKTQMISAHGINQTTYTNMKRSEKLLKEAHRHSLLMLLCITAGILSICGLLEGIQSHSNGATIGGFGLFTILLIMAAIHNGTESWRILELRDLEIQIEESNQTEP